MYKLKYITLQRLVDAAYNCGLAGIPVHIYIAGEPGCGKTWITKSLSASPNIAYFSGSFTPHQYRMNLSRIPNSVCLFLHDDIGRQNPKHVPENIVTYTDICDGRIAYKQYKLEIQKEFHFSSVFTSTLDFFHTYHDDMISTGFIDRLFVIAVALSAETEKLYREQATDNAIMNTPSNEPEKRSPIIMTKHNPVELYNVKLSPRIINTILRLSYFLTPEEIQELIYITESRAYAYLI